jgi:hypothetical protein
MDSRGGNGIVKGMRLEVEELEIVGSFIPPVLIIVAACSRLCIVFINNFESLIDSKVKVVAESCSIVV